MKIGPQGREALKVVIRHIETDISYAGEGTFRAENNEDLDKSEARKALEGVKWIKKILLENK